MHTQDLSRDVLGKIFTFVKLMLIIGIPREKKRRFKRIKTNIKLA